MKTKKNIRKLKRTHKKINYRKKNFTNKKGGANFAARTVSRVRGYFSRKFHGSDKNVWINEGTGVVNIKCNGKMEPEYDNFTDHNNNQSGKINEKDTYLSYDPYSYRCDEKSYTDKPSTNILKEENGNILAMRLGESGPMYPYEKKSDDESAIFTLTLDNHKNMTINIDETIVSLPVRLPSKNPPVYVLSKINSNGKYRPVIKLKSNYITRSIGRSIKSIRTFICQKNSNSEQDNQFGYTYSFGDNNNFSQLNLNLKEKIKAILNGEAHINSPTMDMTNYPLYQGNVLINPAYLHLPPNLHYKAGVNRYPEYTQVIHSGPPGTPYKKVKSSSLYFDPAPIPVKKCLDKYLDTYTTHTDRFEDYLLFKRFWHDQSGKERYNATHVQPILNGIECEEGMPKEWSMPELFLLVLKKYGAINENGIVNLDKFLDTYTKKYDDHNEKERIQERIKNNIKDFIREFRFSNAINQEISDIMDKIICQLMKNLDKQYKKKEEFKNYFLDYYKTEHEKTAMKMIFDIIKC